MKRFLLATLCSVLFAATTHAQSLFEKAEAAFDSGKYKKAMKLYKQCTEEGDSIAPNRVGYMYSNGLGVEKNNETAFEYYLLSATKGYPKAQLNVGAAYLFGEGVEADESKAIEWCTKSAEQGNSKAFTCLANIHSLRNTKEDTKKAIAYYEKAIEMGETDAMLFLAKTYDLEGDMEQAVKWYTIAAENGQAIAQVELGGMYMIGEYIPENFAKAFNLFSLAAEQGDASGIFYLGVMYEFGINAEGANAEPDIAKAMENYRIAAEGGYDKAQLMMAEKALNADKPNPEEAAKWLALAAEQENTTAMRKLALLYLREDFFPADYKKAFDLLSKALELGDVEAAFDLGIMYEYGEGMDIDLEKAAECYIIAGENGNIDAQIKLGTMYTAGNGVEQNEQEAIRW